MGKYLVTGRSGTGKSAVCAELCKRGYRTISTDSAVGLSSWINPKSGQSVQVDYTKPIDKTEAAWCWDAAVLESLLENKDELIFCGSADNELQFHDRFDKVIVLTVKPKTQIERILSRTSHDYGKLPAMQKQIVAEQASFVDDAVARGATTVDNTGPIERTCDKIVMTIKEQP